MSLSEKSRPDVPSTLPTPARSFMTDSQWETLMALFDAVVPSVISASDAEAFAAAGDTKPRVVLPDDEFEAKINYAIEALAQSGRTATYEEMAAFFKLRMADDPDFEDACLRILASSPQREALAQVLGLMGSWFGSLFLTGHLFPITKQPGQTRQSIIKSWFDSWLPPFRIMAKNITSLAQNAAAQTNQSFFRLSGYTDVPKDWERVEGYDFKFVQAPIGGPDAHVIETDVVIVGSGCGAGVCAKNLAEAGHKVLVVEKAYSFPTSTFPMTQPDALCSLYDNGGVYMSEDGSVGVLAGSTWGGGGAVNWSVCFKLQDYVRKEWSDDGKLPFFTSSDFDDCVESAFKFAGSTTDGVRHNHRNQMILDGAKKLGWKAGTAPQNTAGEDHYCGHCHLGCHSGKKRGPNVSWLPAAGEAGAEFMEGFQVDKVLFAEDGKTAIGVEGTWTSRDGGGGLRNPSEKHSRKVVVKAKRVIISAGSLWSPVLLLNSGIENPQVGRNLHLHPCNLLTATWDENTLPWEGSNITAYCSEFENLDGNGHGVKIEPSAMTPYAAMAMRNWSGGADVKQHLVDFNRSATYIILTRDRDGGRVTKTPVSGVPHLNYSPSAFDGDHAMQGLVALCKICYTTGATQIQPFLTKMPPFIRKEGRTKDEGKTEDPEFTDPDFAEWLRLLRRTGNTAPEGIWSSAHQMGSCRMSSSSDKGVVDGNGKVWGRENLFVADASVFPSASGVNPMGTVLTLAEWISRGVDQGLKA